MAKSFLEVTVYEDEGITQAGIEFTEEIVYCDGKVAKFVLHSVDELDQIINVLCDIRKSCIGDTDDDDDDGYDMVTEGNA